MLKRITALFKGRERSGIQAIAALRASDLDLVRRIRGRRLTYLAEGKLASLAQTVRLLDEKAIPGRIVEAGCALGGSSILMASLKSPGRPLDVYDVFGMIPPPTQEDTADVHARYKTIVEGQSAGIDGDKYYGYEENLYDLVLSNFRSFGIEPAERSVSLIKGLLQDTMSIDGPVAMAHVDVDWFDPVLTCLQRIFPNLVTGGSIILDDYHDWGGCRKATDQFLRGVVGQFALDDSAGSMNITRTRARMAT